MAIRSYKIFTLTTVLEAVLKLNVNKNEEINKLLIFQSFQHYNKISANFNKFFLRKITIIRKENETEIFLPFFYDCIYYFCPNNQYKDY